MYATIKSVKHFMVSRARECDPLKSDIFHRYWVADNCCPIVIPCQGSELFFLFFETGFLLCCPGCPGTCPVDQADLELKSTCLLPPKCI